MAITTTALFKTYAKITHADDDTLIGTLIARAQDAIEDYCDRAFDSTTYREQYDGDGSTDLILKQYPVTEVKMLSTATMQPVYIKNTSSDAYKAHVKVTSTTMTLSIDGGTNDGSDDLTLTSYTLTSLVAAIIALGKSWTATLADSAYGVWDAEEILPCSGLECLDSLAYVKVPYEPVEEYQVYENQGRIYYSGGFPSGHNNITIRYVAGYSTMPNNLVQICIDLVNSYYQNRGTTTGVKSEKLGDHSIAYAEEGSERLPKDIMQRLAPYAKWRMAV